MVCAEETNYSLHLMQIAKTVLHREAHVVGSREVFLARRPAKWRLHIPVGWIAIDPRTVSKTLYIATDNGDYVSFNQGVSNM
jgi:hypothetical protein